ncbi:DUF6708 domain-containing protein [Xanthomonas fragariae]|uniref:DUF6708 domain-containing protein n=1 Tax=Xanthomonas fragariae TaxID=48664 RepID=UPI0011AB8801|nr:hypothetical protein [Xanthomonas fragariae]WIY72366.1 hypothetical protein OW158_19320 [Xanthomonas fragariae]
MSQDVIPEDSLSLISFNSNFAEFVDRTFKIKGMSATAGAGAAVLFLALMSFFIASLIVRDPGSAFENIFGFVMALFILSWGAFFWKIHLRHDLFSYTHYPVRFCRNEGNIHFFRHNGPGGVVTVPWGSDSVYFHIGHGAQNKNLRDLRCHILDEHGWISGTYTVGHSTDDELRVREQWEFIRRYMELGPERAVDHPLDGVITLSVKPSWRNCYMWVCFAMGTNLFPLRHALFPIYGLLTLTRWLTFKTCKEPVWPKEVQAGCAIQPNDLHHWPEPEYIGQFANRKDVYDRAVERSRLRKRR